MAENKNSAITSILQANGLKNIVKEHFLQKSKMAEKLKIHFDLVSYISQFFTVFLNLNYFKLTKRKSEIPTFDGHF
jgi:hypothetical protein